MIALRNQTAWTQKFLEAAGREFDDQIVDKLRGAWWFNPLNASSMRLSKEGVNYVTGHAKIHYYSHDLISIILPKTLLQLEKILDCPYYIARLQKIIVFDERTSITLTLYGNDLQTYLDNVQKFN